MQRKRMIGLGSNYGGRPWSDGLDYGGTKPDSDYPDLGHGPPMETSASPPSSQSGADDPYLRDPEHAYSMGDEGEADLVLQQAFQMGQDGASWDDVYSALDLGMIEGNSEDPVFRGDLSEIQMAHEAGMRGVPFRSGPNASNRPMR